MKPSLGSDACNLSASDSTCNSVAPSNGAIPFSASLIEQIDRANWDTYAQSMLLRLGYDAGQYGVIDQLVLARAIKQVQTDMGMRPTGQMNTPLGEILRIRNLGI